MSHGRFPELARTLTHTHTHPGESAVLKEQNETAVLDSAERALEELNRQSLELRSKLMDIDRRKAEIEAHIKEQRRRITVCRLWPTLSLTRCRSPCQQSMCAFQVIRLWGHFTCCCFILHPTHAQPKVSFLAHNPNLSSTSSAPFPLCPGPFAAEVRAGGGTHDSAAAAAQHTAGSAPGHEPQ